MVPRPKSPDGKRVPMSTRFSEAEADAIDAGRGSIDRSEWLRVAALAYLAATGSRRQSAPPVQARGQRVKSGPPPNKPVPPPAPVRFREPEPERPPKNCKHPNLRVKGVCPDCHQWVAGKP